MADKVYMNYDGTMTVYGESVQTRVHDDEKMILSNTMSELQLDS